MIDSAVLNGLLLREWDTSIRMTSCGLLKSDISVRNNSIYIGFDKKTGCCIGFPVQQDEEIGIIYISGAVCLETVYNEMAGKILMISCLKSGLKEIFSVFCSELINEVSSGLEDIKETALRFIIEWRELLGSGSSVFNSNLITGLIGEMLFIKHTAERIPHVFSSWLGPDASVHDFRFNNNFIEVKTSLIRNRTIIHSNGLNQFDVNPDEKLLLGFCRLEKVRSGGFSAEELISELEINFPAFIKDRINEIRSEIPDEILNKRYRLLEYRIYKADDSFPALRKSDFKNNSLPHGIINIEYTADLSGYEYITLEEWINKDAEAYCSQEMLKYD